MASNKLHTLDGMRGIAAIAVVACHIGVWTPIRWLVPHGYLAVDFFFCLSGFVISYVYAERFQTGLSFKNFLVQRFIRLYPVIAIGMSLGFAYTLAFSVYTKNDIFSLTDVFYAFAQSIFLIPHLGFQSPIGPSIYPLNSPFWSIFYEVLINVIWALFLRKLPPALVAAFAVFFSLLFFTYGPDLNIGGEWNNFLWGCLRVLLGFTLGVYVQKLTASPNIVIPQVRSFWLLIVLSLALIEPWKLGVWYDLCCAILLFPTLVFLGVAAISSVKENRILEFAGDISYPLYGVHKPFCSGVIAVLLKLLPSPVAQVAIVFTGITVSILSSYIVLKYFDEPIRAVMRREWQKQFRAKRLAV